MPIRADSGRAAAGTGDDVTVADSRQLSGRTEPPGYALSTPAAVTLSSIGAAGVALLVLGHAPQPVLVNPPLIAHLAGMLAGYAVTLMVLLMSRTPALERGVGADRMARWHGRLGGTTVTLMIVHAVAATLGWGEVQGITPWQATTEVLDMPGLIAATLATILFIGIGLVSMRGARRRLRYETWHTLHILTYLAIALSFSHELAGPDLAGNFLAQLTWSCFYTVSFALLLRYRVVGPLLEAWRHQLHVESVAPAGPRTVTIIVRGRHLEELQAEPGQFFRWRFLARTSWVTAHPFSLSAPATDHQLRLTVKAAGDGTRLIQTLRPGTRVLAEGPYGAMTERRRTRNGVLLIAGGVGITPMRTLFETLTITGPLTLVYRASTRADLLFCEELAHIAATRGAQLIYLVGPSVDPANAVTAGNLTRLVPDIRQRDIYLCAAPGLSNAARGALAGAGVPRRQIHQEEFAF
jgi:predicted ferric reductase